MELVFLVEFWIQFTDRTRIVRDGLSRRRARRPHLLCRQVWLDLPL